MNAVEPIRDLELIQKCYDVAREHDKRRRHRETSWELILLVGFNTSLRVSDLRRFKVKDLRGNDYARMRAKKTGKEARVLINPVARRDLNRLLAGREPDSLIFESCQRDPVTRKRRPISRQRFYQIMNEIARQAGIQDPIGCHTLRKTFGYHYYQQTGDIVSLQRILGHSFQRETLVYIGVVQENIDASLKDFTCLTPKRRRG